MAKIEPVCVSLYFIELRLGYTISQVVHAYGAVCQSITEFVQTKSFKIKSAEFHDLNLSLDCAIAEAVTEFEKAQRKNVSRDEVERLGFLIHELGNSLAAASIAYKMIQKGHVGSGGSTSKVLNGAHERMRHLIDSSLAEVRLRADAPVDRSPMRLIDVMSEVEATAMIMGTSKEVRLEFDIDSEVRLNADRHLVFSAVSNLVNNAMKFSEELFQPFIQKGANKSGLGLGLSLSRRAIELNQGTLTVRNLVAKGCVFTIDLPKRAEIVQRAA